MRRTLTLRRDTLADLTPADLAAVAGGQLDSILCTVQDCLVIRHPSQIIDNVVISLCGCPWTNGC